MKQATNQLGNCIDRVVTFGGRTDIVFTATETGHFTSLAPIKVAFTAAATKQISGNRGYREGADERAAIAKSIRASMRDIAELAKAMHNAGIDVGSIESFRMPYTGSYRHLAATARAFVDLVEDRKALFVARGLSETFDDDLLAEVAQLEGRGNTSEASRGKQVNGTASLDAMAAAGMLIVRELRAIFRVKFRQQPGLLAEWKSISRVHRGSQSPETTPPGDTGSGTTPPSGS